MYDMGGCGSKPEVLKEHEDQQHDEHKTPKVEGEAGSQLSVFHETLREDLGDHQFDDKRPSLSYLFHQSEDEKAKTISEKNEGEEKVKEEESERGEKGSNNEISEGKKQESQEAKHKLSEETQSSNKAVKCEGNDSEQQMQAEAHTSAKSSEDCEDQQLNEALFKAQIGP